MSKNSRRDFLGNVTVAAGAVVAVGGATAVAEATANAAKRRAIPGSPGAPFSRAVVIGDTAFIAGVVGRKPGSKGMASLEFEPQCRQAMLNLQASVEAAGSALNQVLKCNCFLTDVADFPTMNKLFREFFPQQPPARSTVVVKELVVTGAKIEIDCVTAMP